MKENVAYEIDADEYAKIGSPELSFELTILPSGEIAGARFHLCQLGAVNDDRASAYFDTNDEAIAAGYDVGADVSWSASGEFDHDGSPLRVDTAMEWSGH